MVCGNEWNVGIIFILELQVIVSLLLLKQSYMQSTLGSDTPRVSTKINLCMNFTAESLTPLLVCGDQTNSRIRALHWMSVSHCDRRLRLVQLREGVLNEWSSITDVSATHSWRNNNGNTLVKICTTTLTVKGLVSWSSPAKVSIDWDATRKTETREVSIRWI